MTPRLISVDWGTTSLRCSLLDDRGNLIECVKSAGGIMQIEGQGFADVLMEQIGRWLPRFPENTSIPVLMSGMIGSRQGWREADYLRCPAAPVDLAQSLLPVKTDAEALGRCDIRIVPGMDLLDTGGLDSGGLKTCGRDAGGVPDVMRGEETQVLGALMDAGLDGGLFVLPGTHSKWVLVEERKIISFRTFMTGEIFMALMNATILGRLASSDVHDAAGFEFGVKTALNAFGANGSAVGPGGLLSLVFSARSRVLLGGLPDAAVGSYLSGILIGAEIQSATVLLRSALASSGSDADRLALEDGGGVIRLLGGHELVSRYATAAAIAGIETLEVAENVVSVAHFEIARLARIIT